MENTAHFDVVIAGGGPAGLSAALALGRARRRVLLCDAGPRRNAAAEHIHNFVTRDGTSPNEFRRIGREQLVAYTSVDVRQAAIQAIAGARGAFEVRLDSETVRARRVILCTGMIDELPALEGIQALWGTSIFQCPYCHGWEIQDRRFAALIGSVEMLEFALLLRGWSRQVVALTNGRFAIPAEAAARLASGGVRLEERTVARLLAHEGRLAGIEFSEGPKMDCDALFTHPPQRQVELVHALGLALDEQGYVKVDPMTRETSIPGIYAGGDLLTRMQGAIMAAAAGTQAAAMLNHFLTVELALSGALDGPLA